MLLITSNETNCFWHYPFLFKSLNVIKIWCLLHIFERMFMSGIKFFIIVIKNQLLLCIMRSRLICCSGNSFRCISSMPWCSSRWRGFGTFRTVKNRWKVNCFHLLFQKFKAQSAALPIHLSYIRHVLLLTGLLELSIFK